MPQQGNAEERNGDDDDGACRPRPELARAKHLRRPDRDAADLATPEARALQAVPLSRIPGSKEIKIFLSHKSIDKPPAMRRNGLFHTDLHRTGIPGLLVSILFIL